MPTEDTDNTLQNLLNLEMKIKAGAQTMLAVYESTPFKDEASQKDIQRQIEASKTKIEGLKKQIEEIRMGRTSAISGGEDKIHRSVSTGKKAMDKKLTDKYRSIDYSVIKKYGYNHRRCESDGGIDGIQSIGNKIGEIIAQLASLKTNEELLKLLEDLVNHIKKINDFRLYYSMEKAIKVIRLCFKSGDPKVRASAFRTYRYLLTDEEAVKMSICYSVFIFVYKALLSEGFERLEAIKLVRSVVDIPDAARWISKNVFLVLLNISEQVDDSLNKICYLTLTEAVIRFPAIAGYCGIVPSLLLNMFEIDHLPVIPFMTFLLDHPSSRQFIRPSLDLEIVISSVTDAYKKSADIEKTIGTSLHAILMFIRSWPGLLYFCMEDQRAIRSIIQSVLLPNETIQKSVLDLLFDIFMIESKKYIQTLNGLSGKSHLETLETHPFLLKDHQHLLDCYLALLLAVFIQSELLETLILCIKKSTSKLIITRSIILLGEILEMCFRLLPPSYTVPVQSLPRLFELAASYDNENDRLLATTALDHIDYVHQSKAKSFVEYSKKEERVQKQVEGMKLRIGIQMDDSHFRSLIADSQVLFGKDYAKWNWDAITELLEGPLLNPKRLEEVLKSTKFIKRLLSFYRPLKRQFSEVRNTKVSFPYVKCGDLLMRALVSQLEGAKYLSEHAFLLEIAQLLEQLDPLKGSITVDHVFSKDQLENTMTGEYFTFIGILSRYSEGILLLEKFSIFTLLYHLTELRSRDDLIKKIVTKLDYSTDSHARILLSKIMTSGYKHIRLFATNHIRSIMKTNIKDFSQWGISLLMTQLYDSAIEVCEMAVIALDEACERQDLLDKLVSLRPTLDHLGMSSRPLILRFLSWPSGFKLLEEINYIERELESWMSTGNVYYVSQVEMSLTKCFQVKSLPKKLEVSESKTSLDSVLADIVIEDTFGLSPLHFFGQLTKTSLGCNLMKERRCFESFCEIIRNEESTTIQVKAALWAVGHIGANLTGLPHLEESNILTNIVEMAENSPVASIRGTCYYVLSLIAKTEKGVHLLSELNWEAVVPIKGEPLGIVLPTSLCRFLTLPNWHFNGLNISANRNPSTVEWFKTLSETYPILKTVLSNVGDLCNQIVTNNAVKKLNNTAKENPKLFCSLHLSLLLWDMNSNYLFRLQARRYILELIHEEYDMNELDSLVQPYMAHWFEQVLLMDENDLEMMPLARKDSSRSLTNLRDDDVGAQGTPFSALHQSGSALRRKSKTGLVSPSLKVVNDDSFSVSSSGNSPTKVVKGFGYDNWNRETLQPIFVTLNLGIDTLNSGVDDTLEHSISYSLVAKKINQVACTRHFESLEEMGRILVDDIFESFLLITQVNIIISKPKALLHASCVGIEFYRIRNANLISKKDKTFIQGLAVPTLIGINACERLEKQNVIIDIDLLYKIERTYDYKQVATSIYQLVNNSSFATVEALIHNVAVLCIDSLGISGVKISIGKPSALLFAEVAGVSVTRWAREKSNPRHEIFIALGSNQGNRIDYIHRAIDHLNTKVGKLQSSSFIYESEPMYVLDQPSFLNAVCKFSTELSPEKVLETIQSIETELGRERTFPNGPRTIDLDILFYDSMVMKTESLIIPHPLIQEREFVLRPLCDIDPSFVHPVRLQNMNTLLKKLSEPSTLRKVMVFGDRIVDFKSTLIMGILNVTPDSFSDGSMFFQPNNALSHALDMIDQGAEFIDVGGCSTKPGAESVDVMEEIRRVVPVIKAIRSHNSDVLISIDTFQCKVAQEAISAGANLVNDVSGGTRDPEMLSWAAKEHIPISLMHMRGDSKTMHSLAVYSDVITEVGRELEQIVHKAHSEGVLKWNIMIDPGIGFAKEKNHNLSILGNLDSFALNGSLSGYPCLIGPSRKRFIREITNISLPCESDTATASACCAAVIGGASVVRIHNVRDLKASITMADALWK